jgi:mannosylglycerate hydrolase
MNDTYVMHVISGTHWDREWRYTAEQSKLRLADLIDSMLDIMERKPSFKYFCLDGGMIVLEDYLSVRPENRERLKNLIEAGRVLLVDWYTLPETNTVAPEVLIRNLLLGKEIAEEFGGKLGSGYSATSYGQLSQLPQIFKGFGMNTALFYRGTNKYAVPSFFLWEGKDGSKLYAIRTFDDVTKTNWFFYVHYTLVLDKFPSDTYNRAHVPTHLCDESLSERTFRLLKDPPVFRQDRSSLEKALNLIREHAQPFAIGRHIQALNIEDNARPFEPLPEMIDALNSISPDIEIVQSAFEDYFAQIIEDHKDKDLFVHKGELRFPGVDPGFNGLYGATHSSRIKLKLLNDESETWLLKYAEPFASLAWMYGGEYPTTLLNRAWRFLLQNHPHDSICGAAVDQAHEDMLYRFSMSKTVGQEVTARSLSTLYSLIDSSKDFDKKHDFTITFFNPLPFARKEVVLVVIDLPCSGKSGGPIDPCTGSARFEKEIDYFDIIDAKGNKIAYKSLSRDKIWLEVEREQDTMTSMYMLRRRLLMHVDVPAMGYVTYALRPRDPIRIEHPRPGPDRPLIARVNGVLENEHLKVQIHSNGTFSMYHKATGRRFENLHYFADYGETGSAHKSVAPQRNPVVTSHGCNAKISMVETSSLRSVYRIDLALKIPAASTLDARDRFREEKELPISVWLTLEKEAKYLKIRTWLQNTARDHKLQVNFPTGIKTDVAVVESAFAIEKRDVRWKETADNYESCFTFQPMQNFVDLNDGKIGLAFLGKGIREYEVMDDSERTLAITLLRTHRAYMTANTFMTPEEFDRYTGPHSFGEFKYQYALYPHTGDWDSDNVLHAAYQHKVDMKAILGVPTEGELPSMGSFFVIEPADTLMISALKQSEDGQGIVLRVWNTSSDTLDAKIKTSLPVIKAAKVRMDETKLEDLSGQDGTIRLEILPHKIESILLMRDA